MLVIFTYINFIIVFSKYWINDIIEILIYLHVCWQYRDDLMLFSHLNCINIFNSIKNDNLGMTVNRKTNCRKDDSQHMRQ